MPSSFKCSPHDLGFQTFLGLLKRYKVSKAFSAVLSTALEQVQSEHLEPDKLHCRLRKERSLVHSKIRSNQVCSDPPSMWAAKPVSPLVPPGHWTGLLVLFHPTHERDVQTWEHTLQVGPGLL